MKVGMFIFESMEQFLCFPAGSNITDDNLERFLGMIEDAAYTGQSLFAASAEMIMIDVKLVE